MIKYSTWKTSFEINEDFQAGIQRTLQSRLMSLGDPDQTPDLEWLQQSPKRFELWPSITEIEFLILWS